MLRLQLLLECNCRCCGKNIGDTTDPERIFIAHIHAKSGGSWMCVCPECFSVLGEPNQKVIKKWNGLSRNRARLRAFAEKLYYCS